jgi:hypothetical protein
MAKRKQDDALENLTVRLTGGDRRSTGRADGIARETLANPTLAPLLVALMRHTDPVVRMRAADALEKASREQPELLAPSAETLLREIGPMEQQEIRWHVALMIPRLPLDASLRAEAVTLLRGYLDDRGRIVVVEALTALTALARDDAELSAWLMPELERAARSDAPSVRNRARRLLKILP